MLVHGLFLIVMYLAIKNLLWNNYICHFVTIWSKHCHSKEICVSSRNHLTLSHSKLLSYHLSYSITQKFKEFYLRAFYTKTAQKLLLGHFSQSFYLRPEPPSNVLICVLKEFTILPWIWNLLRYFADMIQNSNLYSVYYIVYGLTYLFWGCVKVSFSCFFPTCVWTFIVMLLKERAIVQFYCCCIPIIFITLFCFSWPVGV